MEITIKWHYERSFLRSKDFKRSQSIVEIHQLLLKRPVRIAIFPLFFQYLYPNSSFPFIVTVFHLYRSFTHCEETETSFKTIKVIAKK